MPAKWPDAESEHNRRDAVSSGRMTYLELLGISMPESQVTASSANPSRATNTPSAQSKQAQQGADNVLQAILTELKGMRTDRKGNANAGKRLGRFGRLKKFLGMGVRGGRMNGRSIGRALGMGKEGIARAGTAGAVAGGVATGLALAAVALKAFHTAVDRATEGALNAARQYAEVSASMAVVLAERDLKELLRDQRMGEAQAGSTRALAESEQRRKDATEPLSNAVADLKNNVLTLGNDILAEVLKPISDAVKDIRDYFTDEEEDKPDPVGLGGMMPSIMDHAKRLDEQKRSMHDMARDAANRAGGYSAPAGAGPAIGFPRV